jgi:aspartate racemase
MNMATSGQRVIGIVGGLGPHAHVDFERRLLAAVPAASHDQDYPEWIVSSIPRTPDRTRFLVGEGPSPVPLLVESVKRLEGRAHFAVIACITAHAFLDEIRPQVRLPILDAVEVTLAEAVRAHGERARIGLLATTGTLRSGLFPRVAARTAPGLNLVSLPDVASWELQEELVMRPIYGPSAAGRYLGGGVKSGTDRDPETGVLHRDTLARAMALLADAGTVAVITGCTEISLALGTSPVAGAPLLDPMGIAARTAVAMARGELPLPQTVHP